MAPSWRAIRITLGLVAMPALGLATWWFPPTERHLALYVLPPGLVGLIRLGLLVELIRYVRAGLRQTPPFESTPRSLRVAVGDVIETWLYALVGSLAAALVVGEVMRGPLEVRELYPAAGLSAVVLTTGHLLGRTLSLLSDSTRQNCRRLAWGLGFAGLAGVLYEAGLGMFDSRRALVDSLVFHAWWSWFPPAGWIEEAITSYASNGGLPPVALHPVVAWTTMLLVYGSVRRLRSGETSTT